MCFSLISLSPCSILSPSHLFIFLSSFQSSLSHLSSLFSFSLSSLLLCSISQEETPLFLAAREGSFEAAQVLLDHYSNRDITDHLDRLPRDTAQERMHHDIVRLLDQYNLVHSPHAGPGHLGGGNGGGHSSMVCGGVGGAGGFMGMRPGPQGKKNRRGAGAKVAGGANGSGAGAGGGPKELKDMKAKRRKKPAGGEGPTGGAALSVGGAGGGGAGAAGGSSAAAAAAAASAATAANGKGPGLSESSVTMSPVDSLESPHSYTGDAGVASGAATSPPLLSSPTARQLLPPVSQMLASQQQGWVGMGKHVGGGGYGGGGGTMFGTMPHQMGASHHGMSQHHSPGLLAPMNITMSREQLPPIVTFQMMPGGGQALLKQPQMAGQMQGQGQGSAHLHCTQMYPMSDVGLSHGMHSLSHAHSHSHQMSMGMVEGQGRQLPPYQPLQSPVDKYPTPPSQHSYATGSEGTTPGHPTQPASEHPYLTPSPESPDPWSSSSPHSNSDWSDVTTSPTPLGNAHALAQPCHTHIPEQAQLQPPAQPQTPQAQQPQRSSVYA